MEKLINIIVAFAFAALPFAKADADVTTLTTTGGMYEKVSDLSAFASGDVLVMAATTHTDANTQKVVLMTTAVGNGTFGFHVYADGETTPDVITLETVNTEGMPYEYVLEEKKPKDEIGRYFAFRDIDGKYLAYEKDKATSLTRSASYAEKTSLWRMYYRSEKLTAITSCGKNLFCKDNAGTNYGTNGFFRNIGTTSQYQFVSFYRKMAQGEEIERLVITSAGYATLYYKSKAVKVPDGVTAYTCALRNGVVEVSHIFMSGEWIPKGTAVIMRGTPDTYALTLADSGEVFAGENILRGSDADLTVAASSYILSEGADGVGFYFGAAPGQPFVSHAHRAYIPAATLGSKPLLLLSLPAFAIDSTTR